MAEEVGGFYVSLKALVDEGSFRKGIGNVNELANGLKGILMFGAGLFGIAASIKGIVDASSKSGQELMTARSIYMSADALEQWKGAAAEAGMNADSFFASLNQLNQQFVQMKKEGMDPGNKLFQDISQLNLNPEALMKMDSAGRAKAMLNAALRMKDQDLAMDILRREGGGEMGMLQMESYMMIMHRNLDSILGDAAKRSYHPDRYGAEGANADLRKIGNAGENAWTTFSDQLMKDLKPTLDVIVNWIQAHPDDIANMAKGLADLAASLIIFIGNPVITGLAAGLAVLSGHPDIADKITLAAQHEAPRWMAEFEARMENMLNMPKSESKKINEIRERMRSEHPETKITVENRNPGDIRVSVNWRPSSSWMNSTDWMLLAK